MSDAAASVQDEAFERNLMSRVTWRCVPLLLIAFIVSYIDRVNIGFAALTAKKDLGMSDAVFGFGAGLFFISYLIFQTPSNWLLEKTGARRWLGPVMIVCGLVGGSMFLVRDQASFYTVRFILGAVEAGLFPGVVLYLTYWLPRRWRARNIALFALGIPLSSVIGAPISGVLLGLDGTLGFKGWQWLYILEAVPALIVGVAIWMFLTDKPEQADWLKPEEREWLLTTLARERAGHVEKVEKVSFLQQAKLLIDPRVVVFSIVFFGTGIPSYGLNFWLPQIVKGFGHVSNVEIGLISALPFLCGAIAQVLWARHSDLKRERTLHILAAALVAAAGLAVCFWIKSPIFSLAALSLSAAGTYALKGPFLSGVSESFSDKTAATGIALVSSFGNLSGFAAPWMIGVIKQATGTFPPALLAMGVFAFVGGLAIFLRPPARPMPLAAAS